MALTARDTYLRRTYNITEAQYLQILGEQGGGCAVCGNPAPPGKWLSVDHDHVSGLVRGLLCSYCNLRIVGRHRVADKLRAAAEYLTRPPAVRAIGRVLAPTATERRKAKAKRTRKRARTAGQTRTRTR